MSQSAGEPNYGRIINDGKGQGQVDNHEHVGAWQGTGLMTAVRLSIRKVWRSRSESSLEARG